VLHAAALPEAAGRIAVLEMGTQVRILELAEQMIRLSGFVPYRDIQIVFTGLRPGEKLEEELIAPGEALAPTSIEKIRVVEGNAANGSALARQIRALIAVTSGGEEHAVIRALAAIVNEYRPERLDITPRASAGNGGRSAARSGNGNSNGNGNGNGNGHGPRRRRAQAPSRRQAVIEELNEQAQQDQQEQTAAGSRGIGQ
jgi:hypothetical protein